MGKPFHVQLLENELERRKGKNPLYSLRAFSTFLGFHASALSRILAGKQELSVGSALQVIAKLKLSPETQEQFIVSVAANRYRETLSVLNEGSDVGQLRMALRESEERFRSLFDVLDQAVMLCELIRDPGGKTVDLVVLRANRSFKRHVGVEPEAVIGKRASEWLNVEPVWLELYSRAVETHQVQHSEGFNESMNRWFSVNAVGTQDDRFISIFSDVSERVLREKALRDSEEHLRGVANLVPDILWKRERDGSISWLNQRWTDYTGQAIERALGWGWLDVVHPSDREAVAQDYLESADVGHRIEREHRFMVAGEARWFLVRCEPVFEPGGKVIHYYGVATDIHEHKTKYLALSESFERANRAHS